MLKKFIAHSLAFSLVFNNLAFATNSIIELDFKDSQAPQRLHTILPSYKIADVSHIEIDTEKQQACVYRVDPTELPEKDKDPSGRLPDVIKTHSVVIPHHDIQNLPWELESEKLILFLLNHTAWLNPLDEDGYKLEFRGGLLGGMKPWGNSYKGVQPDGSGGFTLNVPVVKHFQTGGGGFGDSIRNGELMHLSNKQSHFWEEQRKKEEQWRQQTFGVNPTTTSGGYRPSQTSQQPFVFVPRNTSAPEQNGQQPSANPLKVKAENEMLSLWKTGYETGLFKSNPKEARNIHWVKTMPLEKVQDWISKNKPNVEDTQRRKAEAETEMLSLWQTGYETGVFKSNPKEARNIHWVKTMPLEKVQDWISQHKQNVEAQREDSFRGADLFHDTPSQQQVTPAYFSKSASHAGMTASRALDILTNPTLDNAYERVLLASRQNTLGGRNNPFVFRDIGLSVGEAYDNLLTHLRGEYFGQLLDEKTNQGIKDIVPPMSRTNFC